MLLIIVYILLLFYLFLFRKVLLKYLLVSSIVSLVWILIANNQYGYNKDVLFIFGLNTFPLFAWALGLFAVYLIYLYVLKKFEFVGIKKGLLFVAFYWPLLILGETIGYHVFNFKNLSAAVYAGLPICNCLHAPLWMQVAYFGLGPLYFVICEFVLNEKRIN